MHNALKNLIRPHYLAHEGYVSAGMEATKSAEKIFLNANENPYELPGLEGANRYPEPQPRALLDGYAGLYGVQPNQILATRGADEAISLLTKVFCEPHQDSILICPPTFGIYAIDAGAMPANVLPVPLLEKDGTFALDVENILKALDEHSPKMIYLCSPNNPTANSLAREDMLRIIKAAEGKAAIIADETYDEFAQQESLISVLPEHPNLIILRTLSKSYSLAGMRMGCLISGDTDFIALMRANVMETYPMPKGSVDAALKVMKPEIQEIAQDNIQKILAERERFATALLGTSKIEHIYPSDANFLFVKMKDAAAFATHCRAHNILIRDFSDKPGTQNCLRISVGLPEENDRVIALLMSFRAA